MNFDDQVRLHNLRQGIGTLLMAAAIAEEQRDYQAAAGYAQRMYGLLEDAITIARPDLRPARLPSTQRRAG